MNSVYKTKLKKSDEVDKYKTCLVAQRLQTRIQQEYKEVFAPIVRHDTIRLFIALIAQNSWSILDVKLLFLHEYPG